MYSIFTFVCMPVKDYYALLDVKPGADTGTIKKAFRKLALQHHPDKRQANDQHDAYFREIQEAYSILSDPHKRDEYHYKRWLENAMGHALDKSLSAADILKIFLQTEKFVQQSDKYRMDHLWLGRQIINLFTAERLLIITQANDADMIREVNRIGLSLAENLNLEDTLKLAEQFKAKLPNASDFEDRWNRCIENKKRKLKMEGLKLPIAIGITLLICYLIYRSMH
jgi:molecular chaperone DnaJ